MTDEINALMNASNALTDEANTRMDSNNVLMDEANILTVSCWILRED